MYIKYSSHAVTRMIQRKISPHDVELVINAPEGIIPQSKDKFIYYKKNLGRNDNLIAIVTTKNEIYEIITVMIHFEVAK